MTTVVIVDVHQMLRTGLAGLISARRPRGRRAGGPAALEVVRDTAPDVVLMDLSMPVVDGVEATRLILAEIPGARIVVLTSFSDRERVSEAIRAGAIGYLLKDCQPQGLVGAIRSAAAGHVPLDPRVAHVLLPSAAAAPQPGDGLSAREREVLGLVTKGMANKQIGRALGINERTVESHLGHVFRELEVADRPSAGLWAR